MKKLRISALIFGIIAASLAVIAQIYLSFQPPQAYGVCMVCHARDLVGTIIKALDVWQAPVSSIALKGPVVTTVGVILGAMIAAITSKEFKLRFIEPRLRAMACGFVVIIAGLVISGCPMRLLLRTAYGDITAGASIITLVAGIALGTWILKKEAQLKSRRNSKGGIQA